MFLNNTLLSLLLIDLVRLSEVNIFDVNQVSFFIVRSDVVNAVLVEFPSVDLSVVVGVDFSEEIIESSLDHLFVEVAVGLEFISDPALELSLFEDVAAIGVMLQEDILYELFAERIHSIYNDIMHQPRYI